MECFKVYRNEMDGRIDPHFYRPSFIRFYNILQKSKFEIKTIGEISERVTSGATPKSKGSAYTTKEEGIPFIRSGDINEDKMINFDEILYIKSEIHNKLLKGSKLKKEDVLIAIVGATIGQVSMYDHEKEANINQAIALVRLKEGINPEYVKAFLLSTLGQKQLNRIKRPVARANINLDEIRSIHIILPPLEIENKVVEFMGQSYQRQKQKETEAQQLLDSINDYVLSELGIKLPELKDEMYYVVYADEVKNNRCDAYYCQPKFEEVEEAIKRGTYKTKKFNEITKQLINGLDFRKFSEDGLTYIRVSNINPNSINNEEVRYIPPINISKKIHLKSGNLLITRKGTFGVAAVVEKNHEEFIISSEIFKIELGQEQVNPFFISIWMNSYAQKIIFDRIKTGGIMGHISQEALSDIIIPLPSLQIQNKIAEEVKARMQKSEQLQKEAKEVLEEAKERVERIIIGEEEI